MFSFALCSANVEINLGFLSLCMFVSLCQTGNEVPIESIWRKWKVVQHAIHNDTCTQYTVSLCSYFFCYFNIQPIYESNAVTIRRSHCILSPYIPTIHSKRERRHFGNLCGGKKLSLFLRKPSQAHRHTHTRKHATLNPHTKVKNGTFSKRKWKKARGNVNGFVRQAATNMTITLT